MEGRKPKARNAYAQTDTLFRVTQISHFVFNKNDITEISKGRKINISPL
jgi:hypothetical protein